MATNGTARRFHLPAGILVIGTITAGVWFLRPFTGWVRKPVAAHVSLPALPTSRPAFALNSATEERLDRKIQEIHFDAVGFGDLIDFYRDASGAQIEVDWTPLSAVGVDRDTPVTARLRNIRISKALDVILDSVGGGQIRLAYMVDDGVIRVSTLDDLRKRLIVRTYHVRDLATGQSATTLTTTPIIQAITGAIAQSSWIQNGGSTGVITDFGGRLVILQTPENHRAVATLLQRMRERLKVKHSS